MNESRIRSLVKSITWRIICIAVSVVTAFLITSRLDVAAAIGTIYNAVTMVLYYFHERAWNKIQWAKGKL